MNWLFLESNAATFGDVDPADDLHHPAIVASHNGQRDGVTFRADREQKGLPVVGGGDDYHVIIPGVVKWQGAVQQRIDPVDVYQALVRAATAASTVGLPLTTNF